MALFTGALLFNILGVITALLALGIVYYKWTFQYWKRRDVPYFEPSIPFGNLPNPLKISPFLGAEFPPIYKKAKARGWKYVGIYSMMRPLFMVVDLEILKYILVKDFSSFVDRGFYSNEKVDPLSAHLFAIGGQKWRNLRVKFSPTFTSGKLKAMFQTLVNSGKILENYVNKHSQTREAIDAKDVLACFTTDIISSVAFGLEINSFENPDTPLRTHMRKFLSPTGFTSFLNLLGQSFPNFAQSLRIRVILKEVSEFFRKLVTDAVVYREKTNTTRKDFLQLLIDIKNNKELQENGIKGDGKYLTMDEIAAQCFVFFVGGFETSSTTMSFALFELATHPEVQEKLRNEIRTVLAKHDDQVSYDSLSEMKYLGQVIDETLRKYPPVPFITRVATEDYKLPGEDVLIEKGTQIMIPIEGYHYDEEYYPNPKVFDPDRFSDENRKTRPQYAHLPFGGGPRLCIGERLGYMQSKIGLVSILRNTTVSLNKRTEVPLKMAKNALFPSVDGGIWVDIEQA